MKEITFPYFTLEGSPYEIGYQHGKLAKKQVENSLETYKAMFKDYSNVLWDDAKNRSLKYVDCIKNYDKDLFEEIKGLSDGAGVELEDILCLNTRSEVIMMEGSSDGCTSIAVEPNTSKNRTTILSQNWDWKGTQLDSIIVLNIKQKDKPDIMMVTEAGIIGKIGCNSNGIGVCLNALGSIGNPEGVPLHIILRGILNSKTMTKALKAVISNKNACAANYMIAHKEIGAIDIEAAPEDFDILYPKNGFITHTNHYISRRMPSVKDTGRIMIPDSFLRYKRANELLKNIEEELSIEDIKNILTDHSNYPDAICRHENLEDPIPMRVDTVFSIIMDLGNNKVLIAPSHPCENRYIEYNL